MYIFLDFETTNPSVDIRDVGAFAYVHSDDTKPTLLAWRRGDESGLVDFTAGEQVPDGLIEPDDMAIAWNVEFDRLVWERFFVAQYGRPKRWLDAAVLAAAVGYPHALDKATGQKVQLTPAAKRWCMKSNFSDLCTDLSSRARYWQDFKKYAMGDVAAMADFVKPWLPLPAWLERVLMVDAMCDAVINQRGIPMDRSAVQAAKRRAEKLQEEGEATMQSLTGGLASTQRDRLIEWVNGRPGMPVKLSSLTKQDIAALLERDDLPADVAEVLALRADLAKASVKKLDRMLAASAIDGRVHGGLVTYGAGTGRAAGRLVQPQNMPRAALPPKEVDQHVREGFAQADMHTLAACLRGFIASPTSLLSAVDYSNIEGRVLAWLAGEKWKLDAFAAYDQGEGEDIYLQTAAMIGHSGKRQLGKTVELACGYQGGLGAFATMAALTGLDIPDSVALSAIKRWRAVHPRVVKLWRRLERLAKIAILQRDAEYEVNDKLKWIRTRDPDYLWLELPSGRRLAYRAPRLAKGAVFEYEGMRGVTKTYGGKLTENATQAVARDLLYDALMKALRAGLRVVMHVHDEIVIEGGEKERHRLERLMATPPEWAEGLPLAVEGWTDTRYRK